jgi:outer membrane lipoprotein-sorting protein
VRLRLLTPVVAAAAVVAVAAFTQGSGAPPKLPAISPVALAAKVGAEQDVRFSGIVHLNVDVGLPRLPKIGTEGGADPMRLLAGEHFVQVETDTTHGGQRQRVALLDTLSEYDLVRDGSDLWVWDSTRQLARHGSVDALSSMLLAFATPSQLLHTFTGPAAIETAIFNTGLGSRETMRVAGRDAYVLQIQPRQTGSTIGEIRVAVDAATGLPLGLWVYPVGSSQAAVSAEFTQIDYAAPDSSFRFTPPPGATVVEEKADGIAAQPFAGAGKGWTAAVCAANFDPDKAIQGLGATAEHTEPSGTAAVLTDLVGQPGTPLQSYLRVMMTYGTKSPVGLLWSSRLVSVAFTPDHKLCAAFATGASLVASLEAAQNKQNAVPVQGAEPGGQAAQPDQSARPVQDPAPSTTSARTTATATPTTTTTTKNGVPNARH